MKPALGVSGWRHGLVIALLVQILFWGSYVLIQSFQPAGDLSGYRLSATTPGPPASRAPTGAFAPGLSGAAVLRIQGWQAVVLRPAQAAILSPAGPSAAGGAWSLACLDAACGALDEVYVGPFNALNQAAGWERFLRFDLVWAAVAVAVVLGAALLVLLPISRFSWLQTVTGLFLVLVGADAWLTAFGAMVLPYDWFPLLRYSIEYMMLTAAALSVNAFTGWRRNEARIAGGCLAVALAALTGTMASGHKASLIVPFLDTAALLLLLGYGLVAMVRMGRTAPGPAGRVLALLLVGLAAIAWDVLLRPIPYGPGLQASVLAPPVLMFGVLFELAIQGRQLNREAEEARSDLERQVLEQDASLLRSSALLRHRERQIAVDVERQRLLRDMHDGVGGVLTYLLLDVREGSATPAEIERGLQAAVDDLRDIASAIDSGNEPIDEALAIFHERMAPRLARSGVAFDWHRHLSGPAPTMDARRLLSLYRLLQEGIANALRHARASRIELVMEEAGTAAIRITLSDDGVGFDPASASGSPGEGHGLTNMRGRARQLGGVLEIESAPQAGTRLVLIMPVMARVGGVRAG